jgi:hypothetical protein
MNPNKVEKEVSWLFRHIDIISIIASFVSTIIAAIFWMNGKFNDLDKRLVKVENVLMIKEIMPKELTPPSPIPPSGS